MYLRQDLIYLAGPYSHKDPLVMESREKQHSTCAVELLKRGVYVYVPIAETSALARLGGLTNTDWEYWRQKDLNQLDRCDQLYVMLIDGWKESLGVRGEVKFALNHAIPVKFIEMQNYQVLHQDVLIMFNIKSLEELND